MKYCVDTTAYSRLMLGNAPLQKRMEESDLLVLPVTVLGELHAGFEAGTRAEENEERLLSFLEAPNVRVQDTTWDIARRYARVVNVLRKAGTPIPTNDIWIAAAALELGCRLFAYDGHYEHVPGLIVEAP